MFKYLICLVPILLVGQFISTSAEASCKTKSSRFMLHFKKPMQARSWVYSGRCHYVFSAGGRTTFISSSVARKAKHGVFKQIARFEYVYTPNKNYKGEDTYSVKICGQDLHGKNCTEITVTAIMK